MSKREMLPEGSIEPELTRTELRVYRQRAYHPGCGGEFKSTGHGMATGHKSWIHRCTKCGLETWFPAPSYPRTLYEDWPKADEN